MDLADLRLSYIKGGLLEADVAADPLEQFTRWFEQARSAGNPEPNAMALATASFDGVPNCRMVLLKEIDAGTFVFYTSYESRKAAELEANRRATLLFYWPELERQVRIAGRVEVLSREQAASYFATRPVGHQLGAWASKQSSVVAGREELESNAVAAARRFEARSVPLPPYWGGYRVVPDAIEFWQGRPNRLHDRLEYLRADDRWTIRRLAP